MYRVCYDFTLIFEDLIRKLFPSQKCRVHMTLPVLYYGTAGKRIECRKHTCTFRNSFVFGHTFHMLNFNPNADYLHYFC